MGSEMCIRDSARAKALVELGQVFGEALTFSQFLAQQNQPPKPSRVDKAAAAVGVDMSQASKRAAEARDAARKSAAEMGSAMGKLFFGKKSAQTPVQTPRPPTQPTPPGSPPPGSEPERAT